MRSGVWVPTMHTGSDWVGQHEGHGDGGPVDAFALGELVELGDEIGCDVDAAGDPPTAERAPGQGHDAMGHALVEGAVAERVEVRCGVLGLVGGDREVEVGLQRGDLGGRVVRHADLADLAFVAQARSGWRRPRRGA